MVETRRSRRKTRRGAASEDAGGEEFLAIDMDAPTRTRGGIVVVKSSSSSSNHPNNNNNNYGGSDDNTVSDNESDVTPIKYGKQQHNSKNDNSRLSNDDEEEFVDIPEINDDAVPDALKTEKDRGEVAGTNTITTRSKSPPPPPPRPLRSNSPKRDNAQEGDDGSARKTRLDRSRHGSTPITSPTELSEEGKSSSEELTQQMTTADQTTTTSRGRSRSPTRKAKSPMRVENNDTIDETSEVAADDKKPQRRGRSRSPKRKQSPTRLKQEEPTSVVTVTAETSSDKPERRGRSRSPRRGVEKEKEGTPQQSLAAEKPRRGRSRSPMRKPSPTTKSKDAEESPHVSRVDASNEDESIDEKPATTETRGGSKSPMRAAVKEENENTPQQTIDQKDDENKKPRRGRSQSPKRNKSPTRSKNEEPASPMPGTAAAISNDKSSPKTKSPTTSPTRSKQQDESNADKKDREPRRGRSRSPKRKSPARFSLESNSGNNDSKPGPALSNSKPDAPPELEEDSTAASLEEEGKMKEEEALGDTTTVQEQQTTTIEGEAGTAQEKAVVGQVPTIASDEEKAAKISAAEGAKPVENATKDTTKVLSTESAAPDSKHVVVDKKAEEAEIQSGRNEDKDTTNQSGKPEVNKTKETEDDTDSTTSDSSESSSDSDTGDSDSSSDDSSDDDTDADSATKKSKSLGASDLPKFEVQSPQAVAAEIRKDKPGRQQNRKKKKKAPRNELTKLIPGYTAKLQLQSSSSAKLGGLEAMRKRALVTDKATARYAKGSLANQKQAQAMLSSKMTGGGKILSASFKKGIKREAPNTAGDKWFGMVPAALTEDVKRDLKVIRNRNYIDPKRFYKSSDKASNFVQLGTVVEGSAEYYSARLTKKQRRSNLTEELMADPAIADYTKRKYRALQDEKAARRWQPKKKRGKRSHA